MNNNLYMYSRERRHFGRQYQFNDKTMLMVSIGPSNKIRRNYILRNPAHKSIQLSVQMATNTMQTENPTLIDNGMVHYEGGWPKDINLNDEDALLRHRRKIERDNNYIYRLKNLCSDGVSLVEQNNAINIYQDFFVNIPNTVCKYLKLHFEARIKVIFHDKCYPCRPVNTINWFPDDNQHFLALHSNMSKTRLVKFHQDKGGGQKKNDFFVWNVENTLEPSLYMKCIDMVGKAAISPTNYSKLIGGLNGGQVCVWDLTLGGREIRISPIELAHRDVTSALCWIHSKTNTEFYTASLDGSMKLWNYQNLEDNISELLIDPELTNEQSRQRSHGITVLEYNFTIPVQFIVGTDMGSIFIGNRKGSYPKEIFAGGNYRIQYGPIRTIERNPFFVKNMLVIGDWCARIWSQEIKNSPNTMRVKKKHQLLCGIWSKYRCSLFVTGDLAGELDFWDLLLDQRRPVFTMYFPFSIACIRFRPDGEQIAVGLDNGDIYLLEIDPSLKHCTSKDKLRLSAMFEREQLRSKLLEARTQEIKLRSALMIEKESKIEKIEEPLPGYMSLNPETAEDYLEIITNDAQFRDVINTFNHIVEKVEKQRQKIQDRKKNRKKPVDVLNLNRRNRIKRIGSIT